MNRRPTTQQITWFLDLERNGQLDLDPPYQRKSVWSNKDRKFFLDTIFRNYPAPAIFIHRSIDNTGKAKYHVVDGKQRLETIINFAKNKLAIGNDYGDVNYDGKKFNNLELEQKRIFWDYTLVVDFIDTIDGANIDQVFDRVNRNSINLQPQELRHARFNGWFINEVEKEAELDFWWDIKVSTRSKDKRMKNIQQIAELLLIILDEKIVGFSQDYLNERFAHYDYPDDTAENFEEDSYQSSKIRIKTYLGRMEKHNNCISTIGKTANNLYSIWALISLNNITVEPEDFAVKYYEFMSIVTEFSSMETITEIKIENTEPLRVNAYKYFVNSKGASTDLNQRNERLLALQSIIQ